MATPKNTGIGTKVYEKAGDNTCIGAKGTTAPVKNKYNGKREHMHGQKIEVANHIGVDKSAYSKIEKGARALSVDEL